MDEHIYLENGEIAIEKYNKKIILIVWNYNLEESKSRYNLRYSYIAVPLARLQFDYILLKYPKVLSEEKLN